MPLGVQWNGWPCSRHRPGPPLQQADPAATVLVCCMSAPNWFLALPLPTEARWQDAAASAPLALRRFAAEDLHCTLAFLGPCGEDRAIAAWQALAALQASAITIAAGGWRALSPARQHSAYGLSFAEGHTPLCNLLQRWEPLARKAAGLAPSTRPPLPHVTLLRPRRREALQVIEPMRAWMAQAHRPAGTVVLQELALYTWDHERLERLFRITARRALG
jgi:RNA 2',3'-cyclic 3'-phosphodiesterase